MRGLWSERVVLGEEEPLLALGAGSGVRLLARTKRHVAKETPGLHAHGSVGQLHLVEGNGCAEGTEDQCTDLRQRLEALRSKIRCHLRAKCQSWKTGRIAAAIF